jgi:hypothetical protein
MSFKYMSQVASIKHGGTLSKQMDTKFSPLLNEDEIIATVKDLNDSIFSGTGNTNVSIDIDTISAVASRAPSWRISIEDPYEEDWDPGRVIFSANGFAHLIAEIRRAALLLHDLRGPGVWNILCEENLYAQINCYKCDKVGHSATACPTISCFKACSSYIYFSHNYLIRAFFIYLSVWKSRACEKGVYSCLRKKMLYMWLSWS